MGSPRWSPDGKQIAFDGYAGGSSDIYVVPADGGKPSRVTSDARQRNPSELVSRRAVDLLRLGQGRQIADLEDSSFGRRARTGYAARRLFRVRDSGWAMALCRERPDHLAHASGRQRGDAPAGWNRYGPLDCRRAPRLRPDAGRRSPARRIRLVHIGNDLPFQWRSGRPDWWRNGHRGAGGREWIIYRAMTRAREALVLIENFSSLRKFGLTREFPGILRESPVSRRMGSGCRRGARVTGTAGFRPAAVRHILWTMPRLPTRGTYHAAPSWQAFLWSRSRCLQQRRPPSRRLLRPIR